MSLLKQIAISAVLATAIQANAAGAATIATITPSVETPSPGSYTVTFNSLASAAATVDFGITGYLSLDGANNGWSDTLSVLLNNTLVFQGSYDMGGIGDNLTYVNNGANVTYHTNGNWAGGYLNVAGLKLNLNSGSNQLEFSYNGTPQGLSDEGWSVNGGTITSVPGPIAGAGLPALLAMAGFGFYRRRRAAKD